MKIFLFTILWLLSLSGLAQDKKDKLIRWNERSVLTWKDYAGKPDAFATAAASTATYIGIEYNFSNNAFSYKISCSFSKTRSWGASKTDYILAHEQGHFDIAEIFARELNKRMKDYEFDSKSFKTRLKKIYDDVMREKDNYQNQYDRETQHSILKEKQAGWLVKIKNRLNELNEYAGY